MVRPRQTWRQAPTIDEIETCESLSGWGRTLTIRRLFARHKTPDIIGYPIPANGTTKLIRSLSRALADWAAADARGIRSGGGPGAYCSEIQFHHRPDPRRPEIQVTFRAVMVDGRPQIEVETPDTPPNESRPERSVVAFRPSSSRDDLGRDADAACEACGAIGTIGRANRSNASGDIFETHRFCAACWPEQSARYRARWEEEDRLRSDRFMRGLEPPSPGTGMSFESASWHGTLELVREIQRAMVRLSAPSPTDLAQMAAEIQASAQLYDGEMPFEVEMFVRQHRSRQTP